MTLVFPLLEQLDDAHLQRQSVIERLHRHGVPAQWAPLPGTPCLRFELATPDGVMVCQIEVNTWAATHLPEFTGLDWQRMDPTMLAGLTSVQQPLGFDAPGLQYAQARSLPLTAGDRTPSSLPCMTSHEGPVWIERMDWMLPHLDALPLPAALCLPIQLRLGTLHFPLRRLRRLHRGDLLLLPAPQLRAWRGPRVLFDFTLHPDALTVTTVLTSPFEPTASVSSMPDDDQAGTLDLAQLPLTLEVSLCQLQLPLEVLAGLQAGSVVALPAHAYQNVQLLHGGQCVALGTLVQVGQTLAVQLTSPPRLT